MYAFVHEIFTYNVHIMLMVSKLHKHEGNNLYFLKKL